MNTKFNSNQSFAQRFATMGDHAEGAFERWATSIGTQFERYGWNRPSFKHFRAIPEKLRFQPDYLWETQDKEHRFVECKGTGGRVLKLKEASHRSLGFWNHHLAPVDYFLWDSNKSRFALVTYTDMNELVLVSPLKHFSNDNNPYFEITCTHLAWIQQEDST